MEENPPPSGTFVILNQGLDGSSLIVQGDAHANDIHVGYSSGWVVSDNGPVVAGEGCAPSGAANTVSCPTAVPTNLVVITGGDGNDSISIEESVPAGVKVRANGNAGSDTLSGGPGDDVLEAGENYNNPDNGNDTLIGNGGSDVLYADPGADQLFGGPGNDLLVSSVAVCQGHTYSGGPGDDTVSYGRSNANMTIQLGGTGGPPGCGTPDHILGDNESLEGSDGPDVMIGDNGAQQPARASRGRHLHRQGRRRHDRSRRRQARQVDPVRRRSRRGQPGPVRPPADRLLTAFPAALSRCSCAASPAPGW